MSQADFDKWEPRYASGRGYGSAPDAWITTVGAQFLPDEGTALDLAGGSGRHARWLAKRGLDTTLLDISPSGLALAKRLAAEEGLTLHTIQRDLDQGLPDGTWDVVVVSFFLVRPFIGELHRLLNPGGVLILVHPTQTNLEAHDKPGGRWLFEDGELTAVPGLQTVHHEEGWGNGGRHEGRFVGRR